MNAAATPAAAPSALIPRLVTVRALAKQWGVGEPTIRSWARNGRIPSVRIGRTILIDLRRLEEMLAGPRP